MTATFEFKGGRDIEKALAELGQPRDLRRIGKAALRRGAKPMADRAKELSPKDERDLERSIKVGEPIKAYRVRTPESVAIFIGIDESEDKNAKGRPRLRFYAEAQELGLKNMKAQPYMRPALDETSQETIDQVGKELWVAMDKRARFLARKGLL